MYKKSDLEQKIHFYMAEYDKTQEFNTLEKIEIEFEKYIQDNPNDIDTFLRYVVFIYLPPIYDLEKCEKVLLAHLEKHSNNVKALLLLVYIIFNWRGFDESLFDKLEHSNSSDTELMAMIEYAKSMYYTDYNHKNTDKYINCIIKSVEYSEKQVLNLRALSYIYFTSNEIKMAKETIQKAINNVKSIGIGDGPSDLPSIDDFLNERFKGTYLSKTNYEILFNFLEEYK